MAIIGLVVAGVKQATEHAFDAKVTVKEQINISANDTLTIKMNNNDSFYSNYSHQRRGYESIEENENGRSIVSSDIRLIVRSTTDALAYLIIEKQANGSSYDVAKNRAEHINYAYVLENNKLQLDAFLTTDVKHKFSKQDVTVIVYLPEGSTLFADKNTYNFHRNTSYYNDILDNGMETHYLKIIENDVECLDCTEEDKEEVEIINTPLIKISKNENKSGVEISINEKDGVNISVNDNWAYRNNSWSLNSFKNKVSMQYLNH